MFAVFFDRPHYPSVEIFEHRHEAYAAAEKIILEECNEDGKREATVYVASVERVSKFKTNY